MKSASGNTGGGEWGPASGDWGGKPGLWAWRGICFIYTPILFLEHEQCYEGM